MDHLKRIERLQAWIRSGEVDLDAVLIQSAENRRYFSGFTGTFGYLVVSKTDVWFLTDSRYTQQAQEQAPHCKQIKLERYGPETSIRLLCEGEGIAVLGFEGNRLPYATYAKLTKHFGRANLVDVGQQIDAFRRIKDESEIALLRKAEAIGDEAFAHICRFIKPGMTEREVALELEFTMRRLGASGLSFETIVASGARSAMPHGVASEKRIASGDLIVMDYGCIYEGYCSDMTRTIAVGDPGETLRDLYELVRCTQAACLEAIHAGVIGKDIHQIAVDRFTEAGFGEYFGHGLGHSVGLEIHEEPRFSGAEKGEIDAGVCITVEPGLYLPGRGGVRIEDMIIVTESGYDNLTQSPKELIIL